MSNKTELLVENLSLAARSRLYKRLARSKRYHPEQRKGFEHKRVHAIRSELRSQHIAYSFLRGRTIEEIELPLRAKTSGHVYSKNMTRTAPNWERIEELVAEYGIRYFDNEQALRQRLAEFRDGHKEYVPDANGEFVE